MVDEQDEQRDFDIAVSFAGEDRDFAEELAERLKANGLRIFIDADYQADMWGEDLVEFFDQVYRVRSRYAVILVSRHYAAKMWTRHERRSALARGLEQATPYVLPVRLDDTELDGLRPTVGYLDSRRVGLDGIVAAAVAKLAGTSSASTTVGRVPRTEVEQQQVLALRPLGWEYLYWASELLRRRDALEPRFLDHELGIAPSSGTVLNPSDAWERIQAAPSGLNRLLADYNRLMDPTVQERAFGAPGEPGDPQRIRHLAERMNDLYDGLLRWASDLRSVTVPSEFSSCYAVLAHYPDHAIESYRKYIDDIVSSLEAVFINHTPGQSHHLTLSLVLTIPDEVSEAFSEELDKLAHVLGLR